MYICAYYRPDEHNTDSLDKLEASLARIHVCSKQNNLIWVVGDFNFPGLSWEDPKSPVITDCRTIRIPNSRFLEILSDSGMSQVVNKPTHMDNTLDLVLMNYPICVNRVETMPPVADNDIVFVEAI